jgi:hypothetical protein
MPRFECWATINVSYIVTAASKEEAEALLAEQLGPDWWFQCDQPDVEHPQPRRCPTRRTCLVRISTFSKPERRTTP